MCIRDRTIYACCEVQLSDNYNATRDQYMYEKVEWFLQHGDGHFAHAAGNGSDIRRLLRNRLKAVSYTHLDVYKRQARGEFHVFIVYRILYVDGGNAVTGHLDRVEPQAVSYTHLDVYKRQVSSAGI